MGLLSGLGVTGLTLIGGASRAGGAPQALPEGFELAPGKLPEAAPAKFLSGVVESVGKQSMKLRVGSEIVTIPLTGVMVWMLGAGAVLPNQVTSRMKVGHSATVAGIVDENNDDWKVLQVWVGLNLPPGDSLDLTTG